jgi:Fe-S-cluster containining protein
MSDCLKCSQCCRKLVIEIGCHDLIREPRLAAVSKQFRTAEGPCGFTVGGEDDGETLHEGVCHLLTAGKPCPMLGPNNLCTIYPTRPNCCVGFPAGGTQCLEIRRPSR